MFNKIKIRIKKNAEIFALSLVIIITIISTSYYNYNKKKIYNNYKTTIDNIYLKKTIDHILNNLEPKFKKVEHKVSSGETFDSILKEYSISDKEINDIKKRVSKRINLNKLNTNQKIFFTIDQKNNLIKEFIFRVSSTEKIYLTRNLDTDEFNQKTLVTSLNENIYIKKILY